MKPIVILTLGITVVVAQVRTNPWYCNGGTEGNGGCEANGGHTYCCYNRPGIKGFGTPRTTTAFSENLAGETTCTSENTKGQIKCAP
ncbi:hypothetical protein HYALB_00008785 [Hymenoscyphus albidus]|uniref:Uncharacterized protein n=1 Tax=Hymenoscyphus albidus TaxID=595503 RepID=A0A9N9LW91_9HELO|nr:hypothetical protein HYALB_00008785 [Hymenoscyphus albidus]